MVKLRVLSDAGGVEEDFVAELAGVLVPRALRSVCQLVLLQVRPRNKGTPAHRANKRLLPRVRLRVPLIVYLLRDTKEGNLGEGAVAAGESADERPFSRVNPHVFFQRLLLRKAFITNVTRGNEPAYQIKFFVVFIK